MALFLAGLGQGLGLMLIAHMCAPSVRVWWNEGWPESLRWKLDELRARRRLRKHQWAPSRLVSVPYLLENVPDLPEDWREWFPTHMCQVWDLDTFRDEDWKRAA